MEFFNPYDKNYKSVFRAISDKESVIIRLCMPRIYRCEGARLVYHLDYQQPKEIVMHWDGMCGSDDEWWACEFKPEQSGLFWYHFEFSVPFSGGFICKGENGLGVPAYTGEDFQITVYKSEFKTPDWLRGGIIYQIFPDRFAIGSDGVKNPYNDRVIRTDYENDPYWKPVKNEVLNNDYFGGNLQGIKEKLPYLKELGVSCIYLNPIFEAHSNHRYNTADYMKIDGVLGEEKDLKELCREAKGLGIRIMLDGVFSHVGRDSKYFNMYRRYEGDGAYNSKNSKYYNWFKFNKWPDDYVAWWGIKLLPEIQEDNEDYLEYICSENGVARKWIKAGISGWRLDVADELPDAFLDRLRKAVKTENEDAVILGEVWEDATNKISYSQRRRYLLGDQLDSVMNYPFANAIIDFIRNSGTEKFNRTVLDIISNYPPQVLSILMNHIGTHDTPRAITSLAGEDSAGKDRPWQSKHKLSAEQWSLGIKRLKLASLLQYTLPGVPSLYYGDEIGMEGYSDPFNRRFFKWNDINEDLLAWYKQLGKIRRESSVLATGDFEPVYSHEGSVCYIRKDENGEMLVAVNRSEELIEICIPEAFENKKARLGISPEANRLTLGANEYSLINLTK